MSSDERARLLSLYQARVDAYADVDPGYAARWLTWCRTLLSFGGSLVVPPRRPESDLDGLSAGSSTFGPAARRMPGDVGECHRNVAALWIDGAVESIGTGYALSDDELWRQHSWGVDAGGVPVETTEARNAYVGILLPAGAPSMQFAGSNASEHLKTVLRRPGPRATELIDMIRALSKSAESRS